MFAINITVNSYIFVSLNGKLEKKTVQIKESAKPPNAERGPREQSFWETDAKMEEQDLRRRRNSKHGRQECLPEAGLSTVYNVAQFVRYLSEICWANKSNEAANGS